MSQQRPSPQPNAGPPAPRQRQFAVGQKVTLIGSAGTVRPRDMQAALDGAVFEVTRLLPDQQHVFQYRIKDTVTGQERAVAEPDLRSV